MHCLVAALLRGIELTSLKRFLIVLREVGEIESGLRHASPDLLKQMQVACEGSNSRTHFWTVSYQFEDGRYVMRKEGYFNSIER